MNQLSLGGNTRIESESQRTKIRDSYPISVFILKYIKHVLFVLLVLFVTCVLIYLCTVKSNNPIVLNTIKHTSSNEKIAKLWN